MRLPLSRRKLYVLGGLSFAVLAAALAFGPFVRAQVAAEASRRHLGISVGAVRPGWFAVRLVDVTAHPVGIDEVEAHLKEVRVRLSIGLHVEGVEVHGGDVVVRGDAEDLSERIRAWRQRSGPPSSTDASRSRPLPISADSVALRWFASDEAVPRAEVLGAGFSRDAQGLRAAAAHARVRTEKAAFEVDDGSIELDANGSFSRAHAGGLVVEWNAPSRREPADAESAPVETPSPVPPVVAVHATTRGARAAVSVPPTATDPSTPFIRLPDLRALRGAAAVIVARLAERVPVGAEAAVDAMTWKIVPHEGDNRVAFTIGPGPLRFTRTPTQLEVRFSSDAQAGSTSLSARASLPTDGGDLSATLEGGPVSLSLLGIQEGAAGLVDVAHATVTGTARIALAGDGSGITFDAELGTRGLSLHQPRLALDVVRGIDLDVRARGTVSDAGEIRLDDFAGTLGALHLAGSGTLDQKPDHVAASFRFELPSTPCQSLLDSVPTALLPALEGTRMSGTFGARGRFAFDTRSMDDLELDYDIQDQCRMTAVPATLDRERFKQPFAHRVYLPDGSTAEQTTGPGTLNWTPLDQISPYMQVAVMTTEDGAFPRHRGYNRAAIRASIIANLKARRFVRGASTITMQLAKNLFLSRDKTLARKLEEVVLTDYLEQTFSKDELMELYLNVIEFGPAVYGVTSAAEYYFGRSPSELSLSESLFLSSLLPAPLRYGAMRDLKEVPDGWAHMLRNLMTIANKRGLVTDAELAEGLGETITFWHGGERPPARPPVRTRSRLEGNEDDEGAPMPDPSVDGP